MEPNNNVRTVSAPPYIKSKAYPVFETSALPTQKYSDSLWGENFQKIQSNLEDYRQVLAPEFRYISQNNFSQRNMQFDTYGGRINTSPSTFVAFDAKQKTSGDKEEQKDYIGLEDNFEYFQLESSATKLAEHICLLEKIESLYQPDRQAEVRYPPIHGFTEYLALEGDLECRVFSTRKLQGYPKNIKYNQDLVSELAKVDEKELTRLSLGISLEDNGFTRYKSTDEIFSELSLLNPFSVVSLDGGKLLQYRETSSEFRAKEQLGSTLAESTGVQPQKNTVYNFDEVLLERQKLELSTRIQDALSIHLHKRKDFECPEVKPVEKGSHSYGGIESFSILAFGKDPFEITQLKTILRNPLHLMINPTFGTTEPLLAIKVEESGRSSEIKITTSDHSILEHMIQRKSDLKAALKNSNVVDYSFSFEMGGEKFHHQGQQKNRRILQLEGAFLLSENGVELDFFELSSVDKRI